MYNILVTGANGQLGSELCELGTNYPQHHFFFTDVATLDITDKKAIALFIEENKITIKILFILLNLYKNFLCIKNPHQTKPN